MKKSKSSSYHGETLESAREVLEYIAIVANVVPDLKNENFTLQLPLDGVRLKPVGGIILFM